MNRVLEFYCGIGGMHYSLQEAGIEATVVQAFDINTNSNKVYHHNFNIKPNQKSIDALSVQEIEKLDASVWLMSPPCQPYTRQKQALQQGSKDQRAKSFLHLLEILEGLKGKPSFMLIENVVGFEVSDTHQMLLDSLKKCGYVWQEFHLSPNQIGIPNQRSRYFLLAKLLPLNFASAEYNKTHLKFIPQSQFSFDQQENKCRPICEYLDQSIFPANNDEGNLDKEINLFSRYMVPENILLNSGMLFDIVYKDSTRTCCFTRSYGRLVEGTGSVLQLAPKEMRADVDNPTSLLPLKLRYFTPKEIANIHGFPPNFDYEPTLSIQQQYRLIGNSLNVTIVSQLLNYLLK